MESGSIKICEYKYYSVKCAAKYLGVHRCTIYSYIADKSYPLSYIRLGDNNRIFFLGKDLKEYKSNGVPKRGRKKSS